MLFFRILLQNSLFNHSMCLRRLAMGFVPYGMSIDHGQTLVGYTYVGAKAVLHR